jgi:hypothetical protein
VNAARREWWDSPIRWLMTKWEMENITDEIKHLQGCINDLISILAPGLCLCPLDRGD